MRVKFLVVMVLMFAASLHAEDVATKDKALQRSLSSVNKEQAKADKTLEAAKKKYAAVAGKIHAKRIKAYEDAMKRATKKGDIRTATALMKVVDEMKAGGHRKPLLTVVGNPLRESPLLPAKYYLEVEKRGCLGLGLSNRILNGNQATYEIWLYPKTIRQVGHFLWDGNDRGGHDREFKLVNGKIVAKFNFKPPLVCESNDLLVENQWNHVVITLEKDHLIIYINGKLSAEYKGEIAPHKNTSAIFLGHGRYGNKFWGGQYHGKISSVRLWQRSLTKQEVLKSFQGKKIKKDKLIDSWNFKKGSLKSDSGKYNTAVLFGNAKISPAK